MTCCISWPFGVWPVVILVDSVIVAVVNVRVVAEITVVIAQRRGSGPVKTDNVENNNAKNHQAMRVRNDLPR